MFAVNTNEVLRIKKTTTVKRYLGKRGLKDKDSVLNSSISTVKRETANPYLYM